MPIDSSCFWQRGLCVRAWCLCSRITPLLFLFVVLAPAPAEAVAPSRGYQPRGCGFDLDDDGIIGEPSDCRICDAALSGGDVTGGTADPDGDGVNEDLIYVDCDNGVDQANCGAAGQRPCRTIEYAFNTRADGPGDGAEDIVCFRGTCTESNELTPDVGGVPGHWTKPASGSEQWDFQFPRNPAMLVGWDFDRDGNYPPFDNNDVAVMDGNPDGLMNGNGTSRTFKLNTGWQIDNSYFEMAHFTVRNYGVDDNETHGGFMSLNGGLTGASHLYLHDLSLRNINKDRPGKSLRSTFNWFSIQDYSYIGIINIEALETGGYFNRGAGTDWEPDAGPARFQNITFTAHSCDFTNADGGICPDRPEVDAFSTVAKIWGYVSKFEWLDSVYDANVDNWIPRPSGGVPGAAGPGPAQCAQDWVIRNNEFIDYKVLSVIQGWDPVTCNSPGRPVSGIVIDRNIYTNDYAPWSFGHHFVVVAGNGPTQFQTTADLTFTNNFISSSTGIESIFDIRAGNEAAPNPGTIVIANNTAHAQITGGNVNATVALTDQGVNFGHDDFVIHNNVFTGVGNGIVFRTTYTPNMLDADRNVYDPSGQFIWNLGAPTSLSNWRALTGADGNSAQCIPSFVNAGAGDFHLLPTDSCATGWGTDLSALFTDDIDDDVRGGGDGWEIGADELIDNNTIPVVTINSPPTGSAFETGEQIHFAASVFDAEEGDLTDGLVWTSSRDGEIGTGGSFFSALSAGSHTITAEVTDTGSLTGSDSVAGTVTCAGTNTMSLSDMVVTWSQVWEACTQITATDFQVLTPGDVTFRSGSLITLGEGFTVGNGATFNADWDPEVDPE